MSISELLVIAVVALIVFGPDKLPTLFYQLGKLYSYWGNMVNDVQREITKSNFVEEAKEKKKKLLDNIEKKETQEKEKEKKKEK